MPLKISKAKKKYYKTHENWLKGKRFHYKQKISSSHIGKKHNTDRESSLMFDISTAQISRIVNNKKKKFNIYHILSINSIKNFTSLFILINIFLLVALFNSSCPNSK